ncbi:hypothetical protein DF41_15790 [Raoultella planticola]|nr:hypothetical protein DF41_15790 [Raoultella planticola]
MAPVKIVFFHYPGQIKHDDSSPYLFSWSPEMILAKVFRAIVDLIRKMGRKRIIDDLCAKSARQANWQSQLKLLCLKITSPVSTLIL